MAKFKAVIAFVFLLTLSSSSFAQLKDIRDLDTITLEPAMRLACPNIWFDYDSYQILVRTERPTIPDIEYVDDGQEDKKKAIGKPLQIPLHNGLDSLKIIYDFLKERPNLRVEISVHSDCRTSPYYSRCLTCKRAMVLADTLIQWGIHSCRIIPKGYQGELPIIACEDINNMTSQEAQEKAHQINRRVELKIISLDCRPPSSLYDGVNGQRDIEVDDDIVSGDQFQVKLPDDWVESYSVPSSELEQLFKKLASCENCQFELTLPANKLKEKPWKIGQLEGFIYRQKFNKDQCVILLSDSLSNSVIMVKALEETYQTPFLMFKGHRNGRDIYQNDLLKIGDEFTIQIEFDFDMARIRPESEVVLNWLGEKLTKFDSLHVVIESHTDCRGNDRYNGDLSSKRAWSIVDYLTTKLSLPESGIVAKGMGETDSLSDLSCEEIAKLSTEEAEDIHQANRRTVVKIKYAKSPK